MRVLVACEFSGTVRDALIARGHDAWSCDLLPSTSDKGPHYTGDVLKFIQDSPYLFDDGEWDLMIAHPPCTYLSVSGLHWNKRIPGRAQKTEDALAFVQDLMNAPIKRKVIENPISCISSRIRKPDQIIQPWQFGHDASKATCFWLDSVPPLIIDPAQYVAPRYVCQDCGTATRGTHGECGHCGSLRVRERWANQTDSGQNKLGPSADRWALRSLTYPGIANAMADQWGALK